MKPMSTFTVGREKREIVDKKARADIAQIMEMIQGGGGAAKTYTVTHTPTHVIIDGLLSAVGGQPYTATITPEEGYAISSVTVRMGGVDHTAVAYAGGQVSIPVVSGDIIITAAAVEINTTAYVSTSMTFATITGESKVTLGKPYTATIKADKGYVLSYVKVVMGGVDVTSTAYADGLVSIDRVTGAIVIIAQAVVEGDISATYTITHDLPKDKVLQSNGRESINHGASYGNILTPRPGYAFVGTPKITMGGADITAEALSTTGLSAGSVSVDIASVSGDVVITAEVVATEVAGPWTISHAYNPVQTANTNPITRVDHNTEYRAFLDAADGYGITSLTITMGGVDVTHDMSMKNVAGHDYFILVSPVTGDVVITATVVAVRDEDDEPAETAYIVKNNLTNASSSNTDAAVAAGAAYSAIITPDEGYVLTSAEILMGGIDITADALILAGTTGGGAVVSIDEVTGDVVITATATEKAVAYTVSATSTKCYVTNTPASVGANGSFSGTVTPEDGFTIDSVAVHMGGADITDTAVSGNEVSIGNVTGEVIIYAEASDGSVPETSDAETFSVTYNLTDVSLDNTPATVANGASFTATLTRDIPGTLVPSITMGGVTITSQVMTTISGSGGAQLINIESVTGDVVITAYLKHYEQVLSELTNVHHAVNYYEAHLMEHGKPFTTTLVADDGYEIASVRVKMGDTTDITAEVYDPTTYKISIPAITDTVYIRAIARTEGTATNLADPTSSEWLTDMRLWLDDVAPSEFEGAVVTNWIPVYEGDVVQVKGMNITRLTTAPDGIISADNPWPAASAVFGDYAKKRNGSLLLCNNIEDGAVVENGEFDWEYTVGGYNSRVNNATRPVWWGAVRFIRFNGYLEGDASDVVITVNN